jgi:isocitrate/isopropylmalate dehydrogenase
MLRSVAMLLQHAFDRPDLATDLVQAVDSTLVSSPTPDLGGAATTTQFGDEVIATLEEAWAATPS